MTNRTMATPGHYGGGVFDILSSPSRQSPTPLWDAEPELNTDPAPELNTPVPVIGGFEAVVFGGLIIFGGTALWRWIRNTPAEDAY